MSLGDSSWKGRKKNIVRRVAYDLRLLLPFIGLAGCYVLSATAIVAAEHLPIASHIVATSILPAVSAPRAENPECEAIAQERQRPAGCTG